MSKALPQVGGRKAIVRTSDRSAFKRCRRKWGWESGLRENRAPTEQPNYFWIGTAGHFALEDYHGYNYYGHPVAALRAFVEACKEAQRHGGQKLPTDYQEQAELAEGILEHYLVWLQSRDPYETVWIDGEPQVEIKCELDLTPHISPERLLASGYDQVVYQLTIDRLVTIEDEYWIQDWKFHKSFTQGSLDFHMQLSAYIWGAAHVFVDLPIAGGILHEFKKDLPNQPRILSSGKLSAAKMQKTTHQLYRQALLGIYGEVGKAPSANIECLNELAAQESEHRDDFIRRTFTRRTPEQQEAQGQKILMEIEDMLNPDLPLYTNETRDCSWDCNLQDICLMVDRNDDWSNTIEEITTQRAPEDSTWREFLK